jgi:hypothetical protein
MTNDKGLLHKLAGCPLCLADCLLPLNATHFTPRRKPAFLADNRQNTCFGYGFAKAAEQAILRFARA